MSRDNDMLEDFQHLTEAIVRVGLDEPDATRQALERVETEQSLVDPNAILVTRGVVAAAFDARLPETLYSLLKPPVAL